MENADMEVPEFDQMTDAELVDYHLEYGEGSGGLEEYVRRLNQNPNAIRIPPGSDPSWIDCALQELEEHIA